MKIWSFALLISIFHINGFASAATTACEAEDKKVCREYHDYTARKTVTAKRTCLNSRGTWLTTTCPESYKTKNSCKTKRAYGTEIVRTNLMPKFACEPGEFKEGS